MKLENIVTIADLIMGAVIFLLWITMIVLLLVALISSNKYERKFRKGVINIIENNKTNVEEKTNAIKNIYSSYSRHRFGLKNKGIIELCQDLYSDIWIDKDNEGRKSKEIEERAKQLANIIKVLQKEKQFSDEKATEIIDLLNSENINKNIIENVQKRLIFLEAYHKGAIETKEIEILELKEKMQRKRRFTIVSGAFGILGSIASILSLILIFR